MKRTIKRFAHSLVKPTLQKKFTPVLVVANLFVLSLYVSGWSSNGPRTPISQDNKRVVEKEEVPLNEPVEIPNIKIKGKVVKTGEMFEEGDEWLKNLDFKVRNKWDKTITYIVFNIDFPETKDTGTIMMHSLYLGQNPDVKSTLSNSPLQLGPNESIDVPLAPHYESMRMLVETRQPPMGNINKIKIWLDQVMFDDGTLYSGGTTFKRNPDAGSPRKWVPVTN